MTKNPLEKTILVHNSAQMRSSLRSRGVLPGTTEWLRSAWYYSMTSSRVSFSPVSTLMHGGDSTDAPDPRKMTKLKLTKHTETSLQALALGMPTSNGPRCSSGLDEQSFTWSLPNTSSSATVPPIDTRMRANICCLLMLNSSSLPTCKSNSSSVSAPPH